MQNMYCIGLDVHKRTISYCVKDGSGTIHVQGAIPATRCDLDHWMKTLPQPWTATMEATVFTRWIYDHLQPHAAKKEFVPALLRSAPGETLALLTKTYHGSRITGQVESMVGTCPVRALIRTLPVWIAPVLANR